MPRIRFVARDAADPWVAAMVVGGLLLAAAGVDYLSGPAISPAPFYIFPVALAAWWWGWNAGWRAAVFASILNVLAEWFHPVRPVAVHLMVIDEVLRLQVCLAVAGLAAGVRRHQITLADQRDQLAVLSEQMEADLRAARGIQDLLMTSVPEHPAFEIAVRMLPARIVGGDMMDLTLTPEGHLAIMIADVCGKGCRAALVGAVLLGLLADAPERDYSPAATLSYLNERLADRLPDDMIITMFYGLLDPATGRLLYCNAGHEPPFLLREPSCLEELDSPGMVLGASRAAEYEEMAALLAPADLLFCSTDGITDARRPDGERLGRSRLRNFLTGGRGLPCGLLVREAESLASPPEGDREDDITLIAVRYRPAPAG